MQWQRYPTTDLCPAGGPTPASDGASVTRRGVSLSRRGGVSGSGRAGGFTGRGGAVAFARCRARRVAHPGCCRR
jgi:hypothetical protein